MQYNSTDFVNHLNKVCKNSELKNYVIRFYNELVQFYSNEKFTKDCFETLECDGTIYNQDVVNELFKDGRQYVTIDQIFTYQFIHFIDSLAFYPDNHFDKSTAAYFDSYNKRIAIKNYPDPQGDAAKNNRDNIRNNVYHELGHCLSVKSFWNHKLVQHYLGPTLLYYKENGQVFSYWKNIDGIRMENINVKGYSFPLLPNHPNFNLAQFRNNGLERIMEALNELLARQIMWHGFKIYKSGIFVSEKVGFFFRRQKSYNNFSYTEALDVAYLYYLTAANSQTLHLRQTQIINIFQPGRMGKVFNSYTISQKVKDSVFKELEKLIVDAENEKINTLDVDTLKSLDLLSLISVIEGIALEVETQDEDQEPEEYKSLIQALLFNAAKNNIINESAVFNGKDIAQQSNLITKCDKLLSEMFEFIIIPNNDTYTYDPATGGYFKKYSNDAKMGIDYFVETAGGKPNTDEFMELMYVLDIICSRFTKSNPYAKINAPFWEANVKKFFKSVSEPVPQPIQSPKPIVQPITIVPYNADDVFAAMENYSRFVEQKKKSKLADGGKKF